MGALYVMRHADSPDPLQVQYDDGDKEVGIAFQRFCLEQSTTGSQMVKVHDFKPGNYVSQTANLEDNDAATPSAAKPSAVPQDMNAPGVLCCCGVEFYLAFTSTCLLVDMLAIILVRLAHALHLSYHTIFGHKCSLKVSIHNLCLDHVCGFAFCRHLR